MATITLGGRVLEVRPATLGMLKHEMPRWHAKLTGAKTPEDFAEAVLDEAHWHLGANEGVTREWLLEHIPRKVAPWLLRLREAADREAAPGEASGP